MIARLHDITRPFMLVNALTSQLLWNRSFLHSSLDSSRTCTSFVLSSLRRLYLKGWRERSMILVMSWWRQEENGRGDLGMEQGKHFWKIPTGLGRTSSCRWRKRLAASPISAGRTRQRKWSTRLRWVVLCIDLSLLLMNLQRNIKKHISEPVELQLNKGAKNMWDEILSTFKNILAKGENAYLVKAQSE